MDTFDQLKLQLAEAEALISDLQRQLTKLKTGKRTRLSAPEDWNPELLVQHGWERNFDPAIQSTEHFEILRCTSPKPGTQELLVLYPAGFEAPLHIEVTGDVRFS